jgi:hypothetical protein
MSSDQIIELIGLLKGIDSVELKLSVPDAQRRSTVAALGMDPLDAQLRQVVFFDTPDLALNRAGVVVRARRVQGRPGDVVVKLRPVVPDELPDSLRADRTFVIEVDAVPGGYVCSGTMKAPVEDARLREVFAGREKVAGLLSKKQRALFTQRAGDLALDDLSVLGPVLVMKLAWRPVDFGRKMVAELWLYPDGSRILELSTKCPPAEAFTAAAETRAYLASHGVDLGAEQAMKTRSALEFFARELSGGADEA